MFDFMKCVAEAVMENGVKGLTGLVPGGDFAFKVATAVYKKYRERKREADQRKEIEAIAQASFESAKEEAVKAVREAVAEVARDKPQQAPLSEPDRLQLETYLSQIPAAVQQSLKRPEDPAGRTVPSAFAINTPDDVTKMLPPRAPRFKPGDALTGKPGWVLGRPLGVGGFGEVWLTRHERLSSLVGAVKFCLGQQARDLRHESGVIDRVMQAGPHPNIVPLLDLSLEGDAPWLMYEYVPGGDLGDWIRTLQSRSPEERCKQAVAGLRQLAAAVSHFHKLTPPVVHRDLKPNNILLDRVNKRLRITDFGIGGVAAKAALAEEARGGTTAAGRLMSYMRGSHTPLYASPQQRVGSDPDPRDDVHAMGVIAFQMLTGRLDAEVKGNWQRRLKTDGVPESLIDLIGNSTSDDPADRPKDAREWGAALVALAVPPVVPLPPPAPTDQPIPNPISKHVLVSESVNHGVESEATEKVDEWPVSPKAGKQLRITDEYPTNTEPDSWRGFWFVNVGESECWINDEESKYNRDWDDCRKYGFLAAGGGTRYSGALRRLEPRAKVFAYMNGRGYVGYGEVTNAAVMARDFIPEGSTLPLHQLPLAGLLGAHSSTDDEEQAEWVVGVRWHKTFGRDEAKRFVGAFANQNVVCKLRHPETISYLRKEFNVPDA